MKLAPNSHEFDFKNSFIGFAVLSGTAITTGYLIGGSIGLILSFGVMTAMTLAIHYWSRELIAWQMGGEELHGDKKPYGFDINGMISELIDNEFQAYNLSMPKIIYIRKNMLNAFAGGPHKHHSIVGVTKGLLRTIYQERGNGEAGQRVVKAVLCHELGHIINGDSKIRTAAQVLMNVVVAGAQLTRYRMQTTSSSSKDSKSDSALGVVATYFVVNFFCYGVASLLNLFLSRSRESLADKIAVRAGYDKDMLIALDILDGKSKDEFEGEEYAASAALFCNHLHPHHNQRSWLDSLREWTSTHPLIETRKADIQEFAAKLNAV